MGLIADFNRFASQAVLRRSRTIALMLLGGSILLGAQSPALATYDMSVKSNGACKFSGPRGGPFVPTSAAYQVKNTGYKGLTVAIRSSRPDLFRPDVPSVYLNRKGDEARVNIIPAGGYVRPGTYSGYVEFLGLGGMESVRCTLTVTDDHDCPPLSP